MRYLHLLHEALHATGCQLHAFVLMDNHVHLLVMPPDAGRDRTIDAAAWTKLRRIVEWPPRAHWYAMGGAVQSVSCGQCGLRPSLLSLH
ncbi:hypothetical protein RZV13_03535 [Xanthomonas cannabis]